MSDMIAYPAMDGLKVRIDAGTDGSETVWLTQKQIAALFDCSQQNVALHLQNIFRSGELDEKSVYKDFLYTAADGKTYAVQHYNLDAVISVGYRVNSVRGVAFRRWATGILRERIIEHVRAAAKVRAPGSRRALSCDNTPLRRAKCAAQCRRCLFGRLVQTAERGVMVECHVARPTSTGGFPLVRPDDFCALHVTVRGRVQSFAGLVPPPAQILTIQTAGAAEVGNL